MKSRLRSPQADPVADSRATARLRTTGRLNWRRQCGCSSMVELQPSKLATPVQSRSPARLSKPQVTVMVAGPAGCGTRDQLAGSCRDRARLGTVDRPSAGTTGQSGRIPGPRTIVQAGDAGSIPVTRSVAAGFTGAEAHQERPREATAHGCPAAVAVGADNLALLQLNQECIH